MSTIRMVIIGAIILAGCTVLFTSTARIYYDLRPNTATVPEDLKVESTFTKMKVFLVIEDNKVCGFFTEEEAVQKYIDEHEGAYLFPIEVAPSLDLQMEFVLDDDGELKANLLNW